MGRLLAVTLLLAIAAGCTDDSSSASSRSTVAEPATTGVGGSECEASGYVVLDDPSWPLREAIAYRAGAGAVEAVEPSLVWYAEHERDHGARVRLSGHDLPSDGYRAELPELREGSLRPTEVADRDAFVGGGPDSDLPSIVAVAVAPDRTVVVLSYELEPADAVDLAAAVEPVCEDGWIAAGGQVLDCVPFEPDCVQFDE